MNRPTRRVALVLAGGGARGAYEAGVLSYLFERIYPALPPGFEFDVWSGTSVGAIHAAYAAASLHLDPAERSRLLLGTWRDMRARDVFSVSVGDLLRMPLRALGVHTLARRLAGASGTEVMGGLVDIRPLEQIVDQRIPWAALRGNLDARPSALCISCTEIRSGRVTVFMDGSLADPTPWAHDPNARAIPAEIESAHVRASAAIPFLFPAVRIGDRYYVDGGVRMNTPLSPALRLGADRVLVVALKHPRSAKESDAPAYPEDVITQPAFILGKVLDALLLDQLEYELSRIELVNSLVERGEEVYGPGFLAQINPAVREQRGAGYRSVRTAIVRPSEDVGRVAAHCYREEGSRDMGLLPSLLTRIAQRGAPREEADLLSYLFFDRCFTNALADLGRRDAEAMEDEILELLGP